MSCLQITHLPRKIERSKLLWRWSPRTESKPAPDYGSFPMNPFSRRYFLRNSGLATLGAAGFVLRADAQPTPASGKLGAYARYLQAERQQQGQQNPRVADPK